MYASSNSSEYLSGLAVGVGASDVNRLLIARNDGLNRRVLPRAQTLEAEVIFVVDKSAGRLHGVELRRHPTDYGPSLQRKNAGY